MKYEKYKELVKSDRFVGMLLEKICENHIRFNNSAVAMYIINNDVVRCIASGDTLYSITDTGNIRKSRIGLMRKPIPKEDIDSFFGR